VNCRSHFVSNSVSVLRCRRSLPVGSYQFRLTWLEQADYLRIVTIIIAAGCEQQKKSHHHGWRQTATNFTDIAGNTHV
jgi:hypothetical protein